MTLRFGTGDSSTQFAIELLKAGLTAAGAPTGQELAERLGSAADWRDNYQTAFADLTRLEVDSDNAKLQRSLLDALGRAIVDENGMALAELVERGWAAAAGAKNAAVVTIEVRGEAEPSRLATVGVATAEALVRNDLAEPGIHELLGAYDNWVEANESNPTEGEFLLAVGANAELSLITDWLAIGGGAAAVARPNPAKWAGLIAEAHRSAGVLYVPVLAERLVGLTDSELDDEQLANIAGLDLQGDIGAVAGWIADLARLHSRDRIVALGTVYAPGKNQILAAGAQDALFAKLLAELGSRRATVGWLATPLDSVALPDRVLYDVFRKYAKLTFGQKLLAHFLSRFGVLKGPQLARFKAANGQVLALFDFSARRQGSSYLLAKRIERWRADVAAADGFDPWFQVTPPAQTTSTMSYAVVRAAFRGMRRFGVTAFVPWMLRDLLTATLIGHLKRKAPPAGASASATSASSTDLLAAAIHGGVWRVPYDPQTVWVPATLLGWPELLRG